MMKKIARLGLAGFIALFMVLLFSAAGSQALTEMEIMAATRIVNLEANPEWFRRRQPVDFQVTIRYDGPPQDGFDVGVFHEGRLVGWEMHKILQPGMNTFRLHDRHFKGDPGDYIVKIRFRGRVFQEKRFKTSAYFTINPEKRPSW
jgi:hypothetical protein